MYFTKFHVLAQIDLYFNSNSFPKFSGLQTPITCKMTSRSIVFSVQKPTFSLIVLQIQNIAIHFSVLCLVRQEILVNDL